MALFESYDRRINQINAELAKHGISSIEEAKEICDKAGVDAYKIVKDIQPICFENAAWAYVVGCAIAIKDEVKSAAEAAEKIGVGLQSFCIPGSVADDRKVGIGHGNLGAMLLRDETKYIKDTYATPRLTEVVMDELSGIDIEDLIPDEDVVVTLSRRGYIKRTTLGNYHQQKRGGKGIAGLHTAEDDFVQEFLTTTNHQYLLLFTNKGRMHQLKVHQVPEGSRTAKGQHLANLLPLEKDEWVANALTVRGFEEDKYFLFTTKQGMVKRSSASLYARCRKSGMIALGLKEDDELIAVREVTDSDHVVIATAHGKALSAAVLVSVLGQRSHVAVSVPFCSQVASLLPT